MIPRSLSVKTTMHIGDQIVCLLTAAARRLGQMDLFHDDYEVTDRQSEPHASLQWSRGPPEDEGGDFAQEPEDGDASGEKGDWEP